MAEGSVIRVLLVGLLMMSATQQGPVSIKLVIEFVMGGEVPNMVQPWIVVQMVLDLCFQDCC